MAARREKEGKKERQRVSGQTRSARRKRRKRNVCVCIPPSPQPPYVDLRLSRRLPEWGMYVQFSWATKQFVSREKKEGKKEMGQGPERTERRTQGIRRLFVIRHRSLFLLPVQGREGALPSPSPFRRLVSPRSQTKGKDGGMEAAGLMPRLGLARVSVV